MEFTPATAYVFFFDFQTTFYAICFQLKYYPICETNNATLQRRACNRQSISAAAAKQIGVVLLNNFIFPFPFSSRVGFIIPYTAFYIGAHIIILYTFFFFSATIRYFYLLYQRFCGCGVCEWCGFVRIKYVQCGCDCNGHFFHLLRYRLQIRTSTLTGDNEYYVYIGMVY